MKVRELMEALKQFPEDMPVLTDGYESGFEEIRPPKIVEVQHQPKNPYYNGEYQDAGEKAASPIKAIVIGRNLRAD